MKKSDFWFKRRRYGWGFTPVTWQAWAILGVWVLYVASQIVLIAYEAAGNRIIDLILFSIGIILATVALVLISFAKGPTPKWRWGKKPHDNKDEDF